MDILPVMQSYGDSRQFYEILINDLDNLIRDYASIIISYLQYYIF
jgi:hypothetical protein